jgi:hypothetical protein
MGEIIRKHASVDAILEDLRESHQMALARGGLWKTLAEQRLGPVIEAVTTLEADIASVETVAGPALAALAAENVKADRLLGKVSDDVWNAIGRPASDPYYSLLFPGGYGRYADGDVKEQPARMTLLVELLRRGVHPQLSADVAEPCAQAVEVAAAALRDKVEAAGTLSGKLVMLGRMRDAVARAAQMELSALKRIYKAHGLSEAEIHTVIPAHTRPGSKKNGAAPKGKGTAEEVTRDA